MTILFTKKENINKFVFVLVLALEFGTSGVATADNTGRNLAATCMGCHGTNGKPINEVTGKLAGIKSEEILKLLVDLRSARRTSTIMEQITKGYNEEQLKQIAKYFSEIK